jgi:hypothetical protein
MQLTERRSINWLKWLLLVGVIALVAATVWRTAVYYQNSLDQRALSPERFEEETGIRVTLIAVTGGGGMVDFRIKVVDVEKANELFADPENIPILIAEDDTELLPPSEMAFDAELEPGKGYFTLYANANKVITRGSPVTVLIGDYRLEPIQAQ